MVCAPVPVSVADPAPFAVVDNVIQDWLAVAVQFSVPPPEVVIFTDCAAGLLAPDTPEYVKVNGAAESPGGGATASETFTVCAAGRAPGASKLTVPEYGPALSAALAPWIQIVCAPVPVSVVDPAPFAVV